MAEFQVGQTVEARFSKSVMNPEYPWYKGVIEGVWTLTDGSTGYYIRTDFGALRTAIEIRAIETSPTQYAVVIKAHEGDGQPQVIISEMDDNSAAAESEALQFADGFIRLRNRATGDEWQMPFADFFPHIENIEEYDFDLEAAVWLLAR